MPISALINRLREKLDDHGYPEIVQWKEEHPDGKVIGYFPVYAPVEMIHAGGMLPVFVAGAAGKIKLDEADAHLQSFVCSVGRSTLELKLDGCLDQLDGMIFPSICEISRGLSGVWRRSSSEVPAVYIHFPQNLDTPHARTYLIEELNRVKAILEEIAGAEITSQALLDSFAVYNRRAELLGELDRVRSEHPGCLRASELYILRLSGMTIPSEEHIKILEEALGALDVTGEKYSPKLRMVMIGAFCERPPVAMLETIEKRGIAIVADDMLLGQRWWRKPLPTSGNPIEILVDQYLKETVHSSVVYHPEIESCNFLLDMMDVYHADGVIYSCAKFCQSAHHDSACIIRICEERGFPYLKFEYEEDQRVFESLRVHVEALLEARERLPSAGTK